MDKWQELTIEVNREVEEAASNILIESGSQGVAIDDSADYLEKLTHRENPWKETRGDLPEYARSDKEITLNLMKEYYSSINK